jgi:hypothetical protein
MKTLFLIVAAFGCVTVSLFADHGPGTSGGGTSTQSAETLKPGQFSIEARVEATEFEHLSASEINRSAVESEHFDLLDRSVLSTLSLAYGIAENFQLSLSIGYYDAENAREAVAAGHHHDDAAEEHEHDAGSGEEPGHEEAEHAEAPGIESHSFDPDGLTDLVLAAKYRVYRGPLGQFALIAGVKIPTGRNDVRDSTGEAIDPAAAAGSGSWDFVGGLAYSTFITSQLTVDASIQYTLRTEHDDFKIGDRFDAGVALAYRLTKDIERFPQFSLFVETNVRHLQPSEVGGEEHPNTGGTALLISPGARIRFSRHAAFSVAPHLPVVQDLEGEQLETAFKLTAAFTLSF